ncbi:MAG: serine/threonine-protein kinase [Vicinamibacterales bacterium]
MTMDAARWSRVTDLFEQATAQPPAERAAWLTAACDDAEVRAEVEAMLAAYDTDPEFLERPGDVAGAMEDAVADALIGRRLGAYRLVRQIGRGGMGVVYEAHRDDQEFDRRAAVKVLPVWRSASFGERFRFERRVLAGLDHPGIARLIDAGTTPDGVTYVVLEFVDGQPVTAWCDAHALSIADRVGLAGRICEAVTYAHQRLVIHRDLKPANILVTADGQPKLLDFGIAALAADDGASRGTTRTGQHSFTPEFASPEQVRGERVTTATDVYSLGVLFYRMLTGRAPYDLQGLSPLQVIQTICDVEPPRPSTVAEEDAGRTLRGDLDAVVMKALQKHAGDRYASVAEFAADLRAWRTGHPVAAAPSSTAYRLRRFVSRHRRAVAAGIAVVVALAGGGAATAWQAHVAQVERDKAQNRFRQVEEFSRSLLFDVNEALARVPGSTEPRRLLLERAVQFLDGLAADADNDAAMKLELAEGYRRLGGIQGGTEGANVGDRRAAAESFGKATRLAEEVVAERPGEVDAMVLAMGAQFGRLTVAGRIDATDERDAAARRHRELLATLERITPRNGRLMRAIAEGYADEGTFLEADGRYADAEQALTTALPLYEQLSASAPSAAIRDRHAFVLKRLGAVAQMLKRGEDAVRRYREALALDEQALAERPGDPGVQYAVTVTLSNLGGALTFVGRPDESLAPWRRALEMRRAIVAADPRDLRAVEGLGMMLSRFSSLAYREKRFADSAAYNREKVRLFAEVESREGRNARNTSQRALSWLELAMALVAQVDGGADPRARATLLAEAREAVRRAPAADYTLTMSFSDVPIATFRQIRSQMAARLGVSDGGPTP